MGAPNGMVEDEHALRARSLLQDLLDLGVVLGLDDVVVREILLDARPAHILEAVLVERKFSLAPTHIVYDRRLGVLPDIGSRLAFLGHDVATRRIVVEGLEVVQRRRDVARGEDSGGGHYVDEGVVRKLEDRG